MRTLAVVNEDRGSLLGECVVVGDRCRPRLRSHLIGDGEGLLLTRCHAVETRGMPFALDIAFLDRRGCIVALYSRLEPGESTEVHSRAWFALELPEGTFEETGTRCGDRLSWHGSEEGESGSREGAERPSDGKGAAHRRRERTG